LADHPDGPWKEWIPGVLNDEQLKQLLDNGLITGVKEPDKTIGESSIDLTLGDKGWELIEGAVKPIGPQTYEWFIVAKGLAKPLSASEDTTFTLSRKKTYVFKLNEKLSRTLAAAGMYGQATAKSSVGRVDVLARLIVDGMDSYECFTPEGLNKGCGDLYLELTPITFDIKVRPGIDVSQLRIFYGSPEDSRIRGKEAFRTVLPNSASNDGTLSVDLSTVDIGGLDAAAICTKPAASHSPIPLWKEGQSAPDPCRYWRLTKANSNKRLKIEDSEFYLLRSKETISVPPGIAIYCQASDETIGEMRIHYAGFVHPRFGWKRTASWVHH